MKQNRKIEDYMKVIYRLRGGSPVRGVEIARKLGVSKPTVSIALKEMEAAGLVVVGTGRAIELTAQGEAIARDVNERYDALLGLLTDLGVDESVAREDACEMEHGLSEASLSALNSLRHFLRDAHYSPHDEPKG